MGTYNPRAAVPSAAGGGGTDPAVTAAIESLRGQRRYVWTVWSAASTSSWPNGTVFLPLTALTYGSFKPGITGTIAFGFEYSMSAANGGNVTADLRYALVGVGDAPDPDLTAETPVANNFTPGADTLEHVAEWSVTVAADERVRWSVLRTGGTHPGTVRISGFYWREVVA